MKLAACDFLRRSGSPSLGRCSTLKTDGKEKQTEKLEEPRVDRKRRRRSCNELDRKRKRSSNKLPEEKEIKQGDIVNITDLLPTDYLLIKNNGQRVKAQQLKGKVVVMYFLNGKGDDVDATPPLIDTYNEMHESGFEVVLVVGIGATKERHFEKIFSEMPWTAIPYGDKECRKRLVRRFGLSKSFYHSASFIIDPKGEVLHCNAEPLFYDFGPEGFPFSHKRLELLRSEDKAAAERPTLEKFLASTKRDFVISNDGMEVPIAELEQKVVALYLYEHGNTDLALTEKLLMAYKQLKARGEEFEVVLVNLHFTEATSDLDENSFWKSFKTMPWLAFPFKDWNCRKLARIFDYPRTLGLGQPEPSLVIIRPSGKIISGKIIEIIEPYGAGILMEYGISAYPFTRESAAKVEFERVKKLTLESVYDSCVVFNRKDGFPVYFSDLAGKRVLFFIETMECRRDNKFLNLLKDKYDQKVEDDEFEVIHLYEARNTASYNKRMANVPWVVYPYVEETPYVDFVLSKVFKLGAQGRSALVAFERDGSLVAQAVDDKLCMEYNDFPFVSKDLEKRAMTGVVEDLCWDFDEMYGESDDDDHESDDDDTFQYLGV